MRRGVLSMSGLETLHAAGFELRSVPNLHAKTAIIDDDWGLAGSGNLTVSGLVREGDGEPLLRPSYRVGDLLVLYLVGRACPAIAEVEKEPVFDPARVERGSKSRSDANRWGWLTEVRVIHKTVAGLEGAPASPICGLSAPARAKREQFQWGCIGWSE